MQSGLPILMYHHVSPFPGLVTVSPETFRAQIAALASAGWKTIGTAELEAFYRGAPLPDKSVLITFDDGYLDNLVYAHPVLAEFGMKAVIFLVTSWVKDGMIRAALDGVYDHNECKRRIGAGDPDSVILRWSEVNFLQQAGTFEFHAHTHTHTRWDQQGMSAAESCDVLANDLALCKETMKARLGGVSAHLCWPQGYFHPSYIPVAKAAGFEFLYTTRPTVNRAGTNPDSIGRVVTRNTPGRWVVRRCGIYASPWQAGLYNRFKGLPA